MHSLRIPGWLLMAATARAITIPIASKDVVFDPEVITAKEGDVLEFHFMSYNHSVVMGDITDPCMPAKSGGFYSGFWPVTSGESPNVFRVLLNNSNPFVFYCSQDFGPHKHCQAGMAGVVNFNSSMLGDYKNRSQAVAMAETPAAVFGGVVAENPDAQTSSTAMSTAGPTSTSQTAPTQSTSAAVGSLAPCGLWEVVFAVGIVLGIENLMT